MRWFRRAPWPWAASVRVGEAIQALLGLRMHRYWQVRQAALEALRLLTQRGQVSDPESLLNEIAGFVVIATDFRPHFTIKATYGELVKSLNESLGKDGE